MTKQTAHQQA